MIVKAGPVGAVVPSTWPAKSWYFTTIFALLALLLSIYSKMLLNALIE